MHRRRRGDPAAGMSLVEVAVSSLVLVVAISGLVVTTVYSRNLSESSKHLWHATNAASATLEQVRHASVTKWADITSWDGMHCDYGIGDPIDPYAAKLGSAVSTDDADLDRPTGMWTDGATSPNFYFVSIHASDDNDEFANTLDFQTYVANRRGLKDQFDANQSSDAGGGTPDGGGAGDGGGGGGSVGGDTNPAATYIATNPLNVVITNVGSVHAMSLSWNNGGAGSKVVTNVTLTAAKQTPITSFILNGVPLFNKSSNRSASITMTGVNSLLPGLAPGPITMAFVNSKASFASRTVTIKFTFADGSTCSNTVTP